MATHSTHHASTGTSSGSSVVGVHYRVGKKIGEGSFGVIFEGTNLLNSQIVAIKFVRLQFYDATQPNELMVLDAFQRNPASPTHRS
jgi:serine/threonine protein kinase